jgi:hypothetical protein
MPTRTPAIGGTKTTKADNRAAVESVLRLVAGGARSFGAPAAPTDASTGPSTTRGGIALLPTAAARVALDFVSGCGTAAGLEQQRPNLKKLLKDPMDWAGRVKATKTVTKAVGAVMTGSDSSGASTYPQAVEMLSFLAIVAPVLEPDRLARIAALAADTPNAYQPCKYVVGPATQLRRVLKSYMRANDKNGDQRVEDLVASLWQAAHDGRWWNGTAGVHEERRGRRRGPAVEEISDEERDAMRAQLQTLLQGGRKPTVKLVADAIDNKMLSFSRDAADMLSKLEIPSDTDRNRLRKLLKHPDPDVAVMLSYIPGLLPDDRPPSPVPALLAALVLSLGEDEDNWELPEKPVEWSELYPAASRVQFPIPAKLKDWHGRRLPGIAGADIELMLSPDALQRNATFMGNCTFSYNPRCLHGTAVIGRISWDGNHYNFAVNGQGEQWALGEVNSRFNHGQVPEPLRQALGRFVAGG